MLFRNFLDEWKTQEMHERAVGYNLYMLECIPNWYKTQETYDKAVEKSPWLLESLSPKK